MQGILGKLGSNFLIAAFIPALGFVVFAQLLFSPILPPLIQDNFLLKIGTEVEEISLFPLILTLLIGYTLLGLNTFIYKTIEGYYLPKWFYFLKKRQMKKAARRKLDYKVIDKTLNQLNALILPIDFEVFGLEEKEQEKEEKETELSDQEKRRLKRLKRQQKKLRGKIELLDQLNYELKAQYRQDYPLTTSTVLPTRFGNILRAAEVYSNEHFGMDAVTLWPRLIYVIDDRYHQKLDESNNGLAFTTNSLVLAILLAFLCLFAAGYQTFLWNYATDEGNNQLSTCLIEAKENCGKLDYDNIDLLGLVEVTPGPEERSAYLNRAIIYMSLVPIQIMAGFFFYNASLPAARQYGNLIRSAYDLFRFDLAKQLKMELFEHSDKEYDTWKIWSEFVALGSLEKERLPFTYHHPTDST